MKKQQGISLLSVIIVLLIGSFGIQTAIKKFDDQENKIQTSHMASDFITLRNNIIKEFSHVGNYSTLTRELVVNKNLLPKSFRVEQAEDGSYDIYYGKHGVTVGDIPYTLYLPPGGSLEKGFYVKYKKIKPDQARYLLNELHPHFDFVKWGDAFVKNYGEYDSDLANQKYAELKKSPQRIGIIFIKYGG